MPGDSLKKGIGCQPLSLILSWAAEYLRDKDSPSSALSFLKGLERLNMSFLMMSPYAGFFLFPNARRTQYMSMDLDPGSVYFYTLDPVVSHERSSDNSLENRPLIHELVSSLWAVP